MAQLLHIHNEPSQAVGSIAAQYDKFYAGGDTSIYNSRFGPLRTILRESVFIQRAFKAVLSATPSQTNDVLRVLDFGCGDGRLLVLLEQIIAKQCPSRKLEIVAYEISPVALEYFRLALIENGYQVAQLPNEKLVLEGEGFCKQAFSKGNINVKLVQGCADDSCAYISELLGGNFNLVLCMFGVISHIKMRIKRVQILSMFKQLTHPAGKVIVSVPGRHPLKQEADAFAVLRMHYKLSKKYHFDEYRAQLQRLIENAPEDGDVLYTRCSAELAVLCFCHCYTQLELAADLAQAGLRAEKTPVLSIMFMPPLSKKSIVVQGLDYVASVLLAQRFCPRWLREHYADFYICTADPI